MSNTAAELWDDAKDGLGDLAPEAQALINDSLVRMGKLLLSRIASDVKATSDDLAIYVERMTDHAAKAATIADPIKRRDLLNELSAQTAALAEVQRIRAANSKWDVTHAAIREALSMAVTMGRRIAEVLLDSANENQLFVDNGE